ncbi:MAG: bifunctional aspartate kinase/homoserine dehydrogenase I [Alphaproteobacteria bacterium]|nr:bifunctional aspartate kinase/homoserine dehydrogenase I [Alphaproteobacteria bacterium]
MIVMKFGGTSVGSAARIAHVASLVVGQRGPVAVVTSAMGGVTDELLAAGRAAEAGHVDAALAAVARLEARHEAVASEPEVRAIVAGILDELRSLLRGVWLLREQTPRTRAVLASMGERLSAPVLAAAIRAAGREARAVDARAFVVTDARHEAARVDTARTRERGRATLLPLLEQGVVPVVTGFIGATPEGTTTLLGRGGSDYSGALVGAVLDAAEVWIWTDVDGILSADPRLVRDARSLERVSYREAAEMSFFGAKVVHPKTMVPAVERGIPLRIRSTFTPDRVGTLVSAETSPTPHGVKVVTASRKQALVTVAGRGLAGLPGTARRIFGVTEDEGVNVSMISQASSEQSVSLVVDGVDAARLAHALDRVFALEIEAGLVEPARIQAEMAVVSVIGEGMAGRPGVSARLFRALGDTGVNVHAIAQGAAELSISAAIAEPDVPRAVRAVHRAFGLTRRLDVVVLGAGRVAAAFLGMLDQTREDLERAQRLELRLLAVATSRRWIHEPDGLPAREALERLGGGGERPGDEELLGRLEEERHGPVVLVDLTAAPLGTLHLAALERGFHVVTANKLPLSGSSELYRELVGAPLRTGARYGYETTFGAGLPVLHTLHELLHTGDVVDEVSGCFSGTLGFLCSRLQDGTGLEEAVREAADLGYTEPDPREDLSGRDVARKALIVARAMGMELEPEAVALEPMVPDLEEGLDVALARHAEAFAARVAEARAGGGVLRYVARIARDGVAVRLVEVPSDSAIGSLRGPDNILVFRTGRYREHPLVVRGPGAGADVTAAGVLGDVLRVASADPAW